MIYTESYLHPNVFIFNGRLSLSPNGSTDETGGEKRGSRISLKPGEFYFSLPRCTLREIRRRRYAR